MAHSRLTILLAHGSSDPAWQKPFVDLERRIRDQGSDTQLAFMELAEPSLASIVTAHAQQGCRQFVVLPLFFAAGRHLRHDVPEQIRQLQAELDVEIELLPPIGEHPALFDAVLQIIRQTSSEP
jgi:sirohydrochlorin cobaltochelatase